MNTTNLILAENPNFSIVAVQFTGTPKTYHYKTFFKDIEEGSQVVVDSPSNGLVVVTVTEVLDPMEFSGNFQLKWLVSGPIDLDHYDELKTMDRAVTKKVNQLKYSKERKEMLTTLEEQVGKEGMETVRGLVRL